MDKDLIIGGASNYDYDKLQYWINSIKQTDFTGDIVLCATNISKETLDKLETKKISVYAYGNKEEDGSYKSQTRLAPHVERFFFIWNFLKEYGHQYKHVIVTDTRDVVFQTNPTTFLEKNLEIHKSIICSSEGLLYKHEPWGDKNILETFGPYFHTMLREQMICNVGTIAGTSDEVAALLLMIFQMSVGRPIPVVDQAVFNFYIGQIPWFDEVYRTENKDGWAIQLGTTLKAVEAGFGEIGQKAKEDPKTIDEYLRNYQDVQPVIEDHIVKTPDGEKYCIVHQWDRVPELKEKIEKFYGDSTSENVLTFSTGE